MRVERVPTATSRMSRRRCSTPISSASSASIMEGVCMKVLVVVVPSYDSRIDVSVGVWGDEKERMNEWEMYVFDLLNGKVCICRHADFLRLHVYDDK